MKFASFTFLSIALFVGLCSSVPTNLERRAGVRCVAKYSGYLYSTRIADVTDTNNVDQRGAKIGTDDNDFLTHDIDSPKFQFDECTTKGWNSPPRQFGQLKFQASGNFKAVTAYIDEYGKAGGHPLRVMNAAGANDAYLDRQWWYANWKNDKSGDPYVILELSGNPNDDDHAYDLPFSVYHAGYSESTKHDTTHKFVLFDVEILS